VPARRLHRASTGGWRKRNRRHAVVQAL
jgi:hypothetical protein